MGFADTSKLLPKGGNRPGTKRTGFHAFVIHETANERKDAGAEFHYRWLKGEKPPASFHFVVDAEGALQLIPTDEIAWHLGDGADDPQKDEAFFTVAVEICVNDKSRFRDICRRTAKLVADVLRDEKTRHQQDVTVRRHGSYPYTTHTRCPEHLTYGDWGVDWADFNAMVRAAEAQLDGVLLDTGLKHMIVQAAALRVRQGPGTNFPQVVIDGIPRTLPGGNIAEIDEILLGTPVYDDPRWGHLINGEGFISLAYCTERT